MKLDHEQLRVILMVLFKMFFKPMSFNRNERQVYANWLCDFAG